MQDDLGRVAEPKGIFRIEELLIKNRTVLMFILVTELEGDTFQGEALNPAWYSKDQIEAMDVAEFTEYYNRQLLLDYLANPSPLAPVAVLDTLRYFQMDSNADYQRWLESGKKK